MSAANVARPLPSDVVIREATSDDVASLRTFRCASPAEPWTVAPELTIQIQVPGWVGSERTLVLVAERRGEMVGVIALDLDPSDPRVMTSQVLAVAREHRREYIAYNLKLRALQHAVAKGAAGVASEVDEQNEPMLDCNQLFEATTAPEPGDPSLLLNVIRVSD